MDKIVGKFNAKLTVIKPIRDKKLQKKEKEKEADNANTR